MKKLIPLLLFFLIPIALFGVPQNITKDAGDLTATFNIPAGKVPTYSAGVKQVFHPNGTNAGVNVGAFAGVPSTLVDGDLWYDSSANALKARINGSTVSLGAGGGGGITGPVSSTDNALMRWDGTGGSTAQDSNVTLADGGSAFVFSGAAGLTASGSNHDITLTPTGSGAVAIRGSGRFNQSYAAASGAGGDSFQAQNTDGTGQAGIILLNDAGAGGGFSSYGSAFPVTGLRNSFTCYGLGTLRFQSDGNIPNAGSLTTQFVTGGYSNDPTLTITAGNPGVVQIAGSATIGTTISTAAPAGASAGNWKLGSIVTGLTLTANLTQALYVDVGGTVYKLITGS